jgi:small-conductance mechanosensitive channel
MPLIRRTWTPAQADEWTREDWLTILISPLVYILLMVGVALACLLQWQGFVMTGVGIVLLILMHWIIDPKLRAISEEYEKKQQKYLEELEASARWKET